MITENRKLNEDYFNLGIAYAEQITAFDKLIKINTELKLDKNESFISPKIIEGIFDLYTEMKIAFLAGIITQSAKSVEQDLCIGSYSKVYLLQIQKLLLMVTSNIKLDFNLTTKGVDYFTLKMNIEINKEVIREIFGSYLSPRLFNTGSERYKNTLEDNNLSDVN